MCLLLFPSRGRTGELHSFLPFSVLLSPQFTPQLYCPLSLHFFPPHSPLHFTTILFDALVSSSPTSILTSLLLPPFCHSLLLSSYDHSSMILFFPLPSSSIIVIRSSPHFTLATRFFSLSLTSLPTSIFLTDPHHPPRHPLPTTEPEQCS